MTESRPPGIYRTVAQELEHEPEKIKGSRHIARVCRVSTEREVAAILRETAARVRQANHHAYAYRLRSPRLVSHASDDGEPAGSAGAPILARLEGGDLADVLVVVSRIFGGTKLGVGGLVRAYGGAATEALELAGVCEVVPRIRLVLEHSYEDSAAVAAALHSVRAEVVESDYGSSVRLSLVVLEHLAEELGVAMRDGTRGRARLAPDKSEA